MTRSEEPPVLSHREAITAALGPVAGRALLDIGCGASPLPAELAAMGAECTGIDPFMAAMDWAQVGAGRWRLLAASAEAMPIADGAIDAVLFIYSLHHVPTRLLEPALCEARRVLKPGGLLYVAEPLATGDFNDLIATFHDEAEVRARAQDALAASVALFSHHTQRHYLSRRHYAGFEPFAAMMTANTRFNDYAAEDVVAPAVRAQFDRIAARTDGIFDQPVKVDLFAKDTRTPA